MANGTVLGGVTVEFYGLNPNLSPIMIIEKNLASNLSFWRSAIKAHFSSTFQVVVDEVLSVLFVYQRKP